MYDEDRKRFLIIGGGPAGTAAATVAATLGAGVTLVEKDVVGGAAHLWDCIPSKTMHATSVRMDSLRNAAELGLASTAGEVDLDHLAERITSICGDLERGSIRMLESQGVEIVMGRGRFTGDHQAVVETAAGAREFEFDTALVSTGSAPRVPDWATIDGERILTTRDCYDLDVVPEHIVIVGSGVTGVEFVHIFASLGSKVTLVVSRQQVLPHRDSEVAALVEEDFLERGVRLLIGARATSAQRIGERVVVETDDGRRVEGTHALLAIGSVPLTDGLGLEAVGVETDSGGFIPVDKFQRTSVEHIYAAGDVTGQMPLSSVASMQGRKIARHAMGRPVVPLDYSKVAQAIFTTPEIASVGLDEAVAAAEGRKVRLTKVPFAANSRSVIQSVTRGFVKVISDPATHVVLGGTIVGHRASELIGILALAVQGRLKVDVLVETLMVHPSMSESLSDAAS
ncbi:MAG TPA: NAD(P)H-quinone dehydrogenase [Acidimicrobiia bacterium]|nr:NAD(P)H-quinone dehydrogenase [Acidimicrobiia bacterium]